MSVPEEVLAMMNGMSQGRQAFAGVMPSTENTGGAPAAVDPSEAQLTICYQSLSDLVAELNQRREQDDSNKALGALKVISGLMAERKRRFAEKAVEGASQPNINAMGVV